MVVLALMENIKARVKLRIQKLILSVYDCVIVSNFVISHRIDELVAFVPCVQFFVSVIVADRCCFPEGICEAQCHIQQLHRVEVERKSNFRVTLCGRVDCVQNSTNDEHLTHLAKINEGKSIRLRFLLIC